MIKYPKNVQQKDESHLLNLLRPTTAAAKTAVVDIYLQRERRTDRLTTDAPQHSFSPSERRLRLYSRPGHFVPDVFFFSFFPSFLLD